MKRRTVLGGALGGAAGLAGVGYVLTAGDEGNGESDTPGTTTAGTTARSPAEPSFAEATFEAPETARVDGDIDLAVSVSNGGDAAGTFSATLELTGPQNRSESGSTCASSATARGSPRLSGKWRRRMAPPSRECSRPCIALRSREGRCRRIHTQL